MHTGATVAPIRLIFRPKRVALQPRPLCDLCRIIMSYSAQRLLLTVTSLTSGRSTFLALPQEAHVLRKYAQGRETQVIEYVRTKSLAGLVLHMPSLGASSLVLCVIEETLSLSRSSGTLQESTVLTGVPPLSTNGSHTVIRPR